MSKDKLQLLSPLFLKYQSDFEKNPRSRVFAPLAETYRKLGMTDKAMEILSQGIRFHPSYVMGYLGLAFCYYDLKQFNLAYTTIRPLVENNRDNLRLQKLFADVCLELGKQEEALETLKYLLFINPRDKDVATLVSELEKEIEERYRPNHKPIIIPENELTSEKLASEESAYFDLKNLTSNQVSEKNDFDDWMTVDLKHESKEESKPHLSKETEAISDYDHWSMKKGDQSQELLPKKSEEHKEEKVEELRTYNVHLDLDSDSDLDFEPTELVHKKEDDTPLVTHTLVDLYCGQGHIEKALEVLEKILLLNPNDQKTIQKIQEIKRLTQPLEQFDEVQKEPEEISKPIHLAELTDLKDTTEEDGRRHLMSLIDEKIGPIEIEEIEEIDDTADEVHLIEEKLNLFLKKIQKRALDYQGRV